MNKHFLYFSLLLFFLYGCNSTNNQFTGKAIELFDIKPIVQKDIDNNTINKAKQKKVININHQQDIEEVLDVNWTKDMQVLLSADINKKDWQDKFIVQTSNNLDSTETIKYLAVNKKVPIKQMSITQNKATQSITEIYIEKVIQSGLFSNKQSIIYQPTKFFKIKSTQSAFFMKDFVSEVEIYFIP